MENVKKINLVLVVLIIVLIVGIGVLAGFLLQKNNEKIDESKVVVDQDIENNKTINEQDNQNEVLSDEDLYKAGVDTLVFIQNGNAYFVKSVLYPAPGEDQNSLKVIKVTGINEKVRIVRGYALGTSTDTTFFLISESGKVYSVSYEGTAEIYPLFKEYQVKDVVSATGEWDNEYILLLKDGKKIQINTVTDMDSMKQTVTTKEIK